MGDKGGQAGEDSNSNAKIEKTFYYCKHTIKK